MSLRIVGGRFRGRILKTPKGNSTRPTTSMARQAVFNICNEWVPQSKFLDLFAGSGAMGIEAISRGASFATFVECDRQAAQCIRENIHLLEIEQQTQIISLDISKALPKLLSPYDLIYIDPPYERGISEVLKTIVSLNLLTRTGLLFVEERFQTKSTPSYPKELELTGSRRYGIAHLHQYRWALNQ